MSIRRLYTKFNLQQLKINPFSVCFFFLPSLFLYIFLDALPLFGTTQKIDNFLDTNIRILDQLDRANIEKNKQWDIPKPVPVNDVQSLITAVVSPKIRAVGNIANDLTTGVLTTITAFSGSSSGGNSNNPNAGLGNIVSKFLGFSGPILQGSSGGGASGSTTPAPDSDEAGY